MVIRVDFEANAILTIRKAFFCLCKMVDNENSFENNKALKVSIGEIIKKSRKVKICSSSP